MDEEAVPLEGLELLREVDPKLVELIMQFKNTSSPEARTLIEERARSLDELSSKETSCVPTEELTPEEIIVRPKEPTPEFSPRRSTSERAEDHTVEARKNDEALIKFRSEINGMRYPQLKKYMSDRAYDLSQVEQNLLRLNSSRLYKKYMTKTGKRNQGVRMSDHDAINKFTENEYDDLSHEDLQEYSHLRGIVKDRIDSINGRPKFENFELFATNHAEQLRKIRESDNKIRDAKLQEWRAQIEAEGQVSDQIDDRVRDMQRQNIISAASDEHDADVLADSVQVEGSQPGMHDVDASIIPSDELPQGVPGAAELQIIRPRSFVDQDFEMRVNYTNYSYIHKRIVEEERRTGITFSAAEKEERANKYAADEKAKRERLREAGKNVRDILLAMDDGGGPIQMDEHFPQELKEDEPDSVLVQPRARPGANLGQSLVIPPIPVPDETKQQDPVEHIDVSAANYPALAEFNAFKRSLTEADVPISTFWDLYLKYGLTPPEDMSRQPNSSELNRLARAAAEHKISTGVVHDAVFPQQIRNEEEKVREVTPPGFQTPLPRQRPERPIIGGIHVPPRPAFLDSAVLPIDMTDAERERQRSEAALVSETIKRSLAQQPPLPQYP